MMVHNLTECIECSCGKTFEDEDDAIKHMEQEENPAVKHIKYYCDRFSVEDVFPAGEAMLIDLSYDGSFGGKVPLEIMEAVYEAEHIVTGTHTGIDGVDARIWVRPKPWT